MIARGQTLKFTAVIVLVVLALTGFSTGSKGSRGSKGRHSSSHYGSGGGGCSSSRQDHDASTSSTSGGGSYSSYDDDDDATYGSGSSGGSAYTRTRRPTYRSTPTPSSGGTAKPLKDGTVKLVSCATRKAQYATVEVTNPNKRKTSFEVSVDFEDDQDLAVGFNIVTVDVPANGKVRAKVALRDSTGYRNDGLIEEVDHCKADPVAETYE